MVTSLTKDDSIKSVSLERENLIFILALLLVISMTFCERALPLRYDALRIRRPEQ